MRQKSDDLDVAHTEELRILADEHEQQLETLRNQLKEQLEKMSVELSNVQQSHDAEIKQIQTEHAVLLNDALTEQTSSFEEELKRHREETRKEREAWEAERAAGDEEVKSIECQLVLEQQEYKSKLAEKEKLVQELNEQLLAERKNAKVCYTCGCHKTTCQSPAFTYM